MSSAIPFDLVGKPFALGGRGPDVYDCWGVVLEYARRAGVPMPDFDSLQAPRGLLRTLQVGAPMHATPSPVATPGCIAVDLRRGHLGIYTAAGVLHTHTAAGVVLQRTDDFLALYPATRWFTW